MSYRVLIRSPARKSLTALPPTEYDRVLDSLTELANVPRPTGCKKLKGREGWRIRVGSYRVIYLIDDPQKIVTILYVGHRRDV